MAFQSGLNQRGACGFPQSHKAMQVWGYSTKAEPKFVTAEMRKQAVPPGCGSAANTSHSPEYSRKRISEAKGNAEVKTFSRK